MTLLVAESSASYRARLPAVIDSSVLAAFIYRENESDLAQGRMSAHILHAPVILPLEIANTAMNKLRRRSASLEDLADRLAGFDFGTIRLLAVPPSETFSLAARFNLSAYDASYLWLAGELHAPLLTFDKKLGAAATEYLGQLPPKTE